MLDFRVLGALDLRTSDGVGIRSALAQPKRVALLTYLVLQGRGGYVRRDTLLALFWPEADTEHARTSLRKGIHFLRQSLGEGVLLIRGAEEVGIDPARLRCDATEFLRALERGTLAEALDLYRGELLEGFHVSAAPEFDEWLESQRTALRERACGAAWALALEAEEAGAKERATQLARRAVALSRDEEPAVRKLIALLGRLGEREWAVRTYEEFAERLLREYEAVPLEETRALVEALRAVPAPGATAPPPSAPPPTPGEGRTPEPAPGSEEFPLSRMRERGSGGEGLPGSRAAPGGGDRKRRFAVVSLLALMLVLGSAGLFARLRSTPAVPISSNMVAVLPFSYHGSGEHEYLGEGMVRLLSTNLNGVGELRSVDPRALLSVIEQTGVNAEDPEAGSALAERFGAGLLVLGHIIEAGGRLRIAAVIYDRGSARPALPVEEVTVEGEGAQLFDMVDELTAKLLAVRSTAPAERMTRIAALTTLSLPALRAFLEGEGAHQRGRYTGAVEAFQRAVELDTTFALAYYRMSIAATWAQHWSADAAGRRGMLRFRDRLSVHDRQLVDAWIAYNRHDPPKETEQRYEAILAENPDEVEAWFQLGEVRFHWKGIVGNSIQEARPAFERVLTYEPDNAGALIHLARLAALERDTARIASLVPRVLHLNPAEHHRIEMEALQAFCRNDAAAQARVHERIRSVSLKTQWLAIMSLATYGNQLAHAVALGRHALPPERDTAAYVEAHLQLARFELARGRWSASREHVAAVARVYPVLAAQYQAEHTAFPFLRHSPRELEAIRAEIAHLPVRPDTARGADPRALSASYQQYLLGLLSLQLGDPVAALRQATQLARQPEFGAPSVGREYAQLLRAQVVWTGRQARDALDLLGPSEIQVRFRGAQHSWKITNAHERWLRAELLRTLGREEEALGWYASFPATQGNDLLYLAPAYLRRAEIHERRGERQQAAEHYRRFLDLWQDADPELQPLVRQARARLGEG